MSDYQNLYQSQEGLRSSDFEFRDYLFDYLRRNYFPFMKPRYRSGGARGSVTTTGASTNRNFTRPGGLNADYRHVSRSRDFKPTGMSFGQRLSIIKLELLRVLIMLPFLAFAAIGCGFGNILILIRVFIEVAIVLWRHFYWGEFLITSAVLITGWSFSTLVVDDILPHINGFCYTCMFPKGIRFDVAKAYGASPKWCEFSDHQLLVRTSKYRVKRSSEKTYHITRDDNGSSLKTVSNILNNFRVGEQKVYVINVHLLFGIQRYIRFIMVLAACWRCALFRDLLPFLVPFTLGVWFGFDGVGFAFAIRMFIEMPIGPLTLLCAMLWGMQRLLYYMLPTLPNSIWPTVASRVPGYEGYPEGVRASGRVHKFVWHNRNNNYKFAKFASVNLSSVDNDYFMAQSGFFETDNYVSGNTHKPAQQATRALVYNIFHNRSYDDIPYTINIGGTFRGIPCMASGLAFQPTLGDSDAARLRDSGSIPGYGQLVVNDFIGTNVGPVGTNSQFDPNWSVTGLGGAEFLMVHVYDIPIKALLAAAYANNSSRVNVIMHADPAMFVSKAGHMHWTDQRWEHLDDGRVEYQWADTNGRTFNHSYRIIYEHLFTDYVCVAPEVWYVGILHRSIFDVYHIQWTMQRTKPQRSHTRTMRMEYRKDSTNVCAMTRFNLFLYEVKSLTLTKQAEEYIDTANDITTTNSSLRALNDNINRAVGSRHRHIDTDTVYQLWTAHVFKRTLLNVMQESQNVSFGWKRLIGMEADPAMFTDFSITLVRLLTEQPKSEVLCETLTQEDPYVNVKQVKMAPQRYFNLATYTAGTGLVPQEILMRQQVRSVRILLASGNTMNEQFCHAIFGINTGLGPILPMGKIEHGGSVLKGNSIRLLPTEIEYLVTSGLNIIVKTNDTDMASHFGSLNTEEGVPIVFVDFVQGKVSRIHYPNTIDAERVFTLFNAKSSDLVADGGWMDQLIDADLDERVYAEGPFMDHYLKAARNEMVSRMRDGTLDADYEKIDGLMEEVEADNTTSLNIPGDETVIPILKQPRYGMLYDGNNLLPGGYVPAHLYADKTIQRMRQLRKEG